MPAEGLNIFNQMRRSRDNNAAVAWDATVEGRLWLQWHRARQDHSLWEDPGDRTTNEAEGNPAVCRRFLGAPRAGGVTKSSPACCPSAASHWRCLMVVSCAPRSVARRPTLGGASTLLLSPAFPALTQTNPQEQAASSCGCDVGAQVLSTPHP